MRAIDADAYLESVKPRGISDELWKESNTYKSVASMPTIEPKVPWIPCSKELPERNRVVLVTTKWDEVTEGVKLSVNAWFIGRGEENAFDSDIIAWMPLPEAFREGEG